MAQKGGFLGYNALLGDGSYVENRPSKWQQTWNILSPYVTGPANAVKGLMTTPLEVLLGGGTPEQQDKAVADSFNAAGTFMGGSSVVPKPRNALNMGIKAFHGSPHSFDKFSMDKIGTGEGAQAYGHGLYFAEAEDVARGYRDRIAGADWVDKRGVPQMTNNIMEDVVAELRKDGMGLIDAEENASFWSLVARNGDGVENLPGYQSIKNVLDRKGIQLRPKGSMYEVNINADPNSFLDWDKPLSEQPEAVQKGFGSLVDRDLSKETGWAKMSGQQALDAIMERYGSLDWPDNADATLRQQYRTNARSKASALLADKGIPGIKYLDAGSRGAGDGTRNYVVFDDKLIDIVRKYGIAGASAMLGYNILDGMDQAQAAELQKNDPGARRGGW